MLSRLFTRYRPTKSTLNVYPVNRFATYSNMSSILEPIAKKLKASKTIGTHSGTFHADESLGVSMLRKTAEYKDADLTRTRDPKVLDTLDIVIDVGGVYDPARNRYDHHQREFDEVFGDGTFPYPSSKVGGRQLEEGKEFSIKLSSAGLVWKHFGKHIINTMYGWAEDDEKTQTIWLKMYSSFVQAIDANDNGISMYDTDAKPRYSDSTNLPGRVRDLNPRWNEESNDTLLDQKFEEASKMAGDEFFRKLDFYVNAWIPARELVKTAIDSRFEVDSSGQIMVFHQSMPWKDHFFDLEEQIKPEKEILYVLYPESSEKPEGKWRIQCVSVRADSFKNRKDMPDAWKGVRDQALSDVSGIEGCIFVHASGFTGGNNTKDGALKMARASVAA
ncbi:hypothetical protein FFLO_02774 [Filobasidium floriforme]|uniref:Metal-dependent protein hydrolase n=1 Tax=Filobasidium floriforme TaxID=5210 RepID=A0A8K0NRH4_9TREE|nr:hypothetical protein FFLO_02774 [Filobasidium floriforme]